MNARRLRRIGSSEIRQASDATGVSFDYLASQAEQESGFRALPVVKDGNLVGMLSVDDVGQAALLRDLRKT